MKLLTLTDWIAWGGVVLPLFALAWSAWSYIKIEKEKVSQRNFENFYQIILRIHNKDQSMISQNTAVFELRNYPQYKEFILNFCDNRAEFFNVTMHPLLNAEIERISDFFRKT